MPSLTVLLSKLDGAPKRYTNSPTIQLIKSNNGGLIACIHDQDSLVVGVIDDDDVDKQNSKIWKLEDERGSLCGYGDDDRMGDVSSSEVLVNDNQMAFILGLSSGRVLSYVFEIYENGDGGHRVKLLHNDRPLAPLASESGTWHGISPKTRYLHFIEVPVSKIFSSEAIEYVLVAFVSGAIVRVPKVKCFQCKKDSVGIVTSTSARDPQEEKHVENEELLDWAIVRRDNEFARNWVVDPKKKFIPLPYNNSSLFSSMWSHGNEEDDLYFEAMSFGGDSEKTVVFYSSEHAISMRQDDTDVFDFSNIAIDATRKVFQGALGAARRFGFLSGENNNQNHDQLEGGLNDENFKPVCKSEPHLMIERRSIADPPRNISSACIDSSGTFIAISDGLGRVIVIDIDSKQFVRIFKGLRDAQCHWIQTSENGTKTVSYLVIHSCQRHVVEIYRMRHGECVNSFPVEKGAKVISCRNHTKMSCFLYCPSELPSERNLSEIRITESTDESQSKLTTVENSELNLRLLRQMILSSDTSISMNPQKVYEAFTKILSLQELGAALDMLASSSYLHSALKGENSKFHRKLVDHAELRVKTIVNEKGSLFINTHVDRLRMKIIIHKQIIGAYDLISDFEKGSPDEDEEESKTVQSCWASEALGWLSVQAKVTNKKSDDFTKILAPISFDFFFKACNAFHIDDENISTSENGSATIFLSDSTRDRKAILAYVFRPLTSDVFVYKTTNMIFDTLGLNSDKPCIQRYFGEWFLDLDPKIAIKASFEGAWRPICRWLQELVLEEYAKNDREEGSSLSTLLETCRQADNLAQAFVLAACCLDAVGHAAKQIEDKTYGRVLVEKESKPWKILLRKIRVCSLVSFRLYGELQTEFPITVANVDKGTIFSVSQWLATDELRLFHNQDDCMMLEMSAYGSKDSFDPSAAIGDEMNSWKMLQRFCIEPPKLSDIRDQTPSLLLYFKEQNRAMFLAAHRALLLGSKWGKKPMSLNVLKDAISAARILRKGAGISEEVINAVRVELWQTYIRPIYRALFFGFEEVTEVSEEVIAPLCQNKDWLRGVTNSSVDLLELIEVGDFTYEDKIGKEKWRTSYDNCWHLGYHEDIVLSGLVRKMSSVNESSLQMHKGILLACLLCDDMEAVWRSLPSTDIIFLRGSLSEDVKSVITHDVGRLNFVEEVLLQKARSSFGPTAIDSNFIEKVKRLGRIWNISEVSVNTRFVLALYRAGKDVMVDPALCDSSQIDVVLFVKIGVELASVRLHSLIGSLSKFRKYRSILSEIDADTCEWIKEIAEESPYLQEYHSFAEYERPSLAVTYEFLMRLNQLGFNLWNDPLVRSETEKAGALSALGETLVRLLRQQSEDLR